MELVPGGGERCARAVAIHGGALHVPAERKVSPDITTSPRAWAWPTIVFGNGKTSLKANVSKYLQPANNESTFIQGNPGVTFQATTNRTWTDANGNFTPDCGPAGLNSNTTLRRAQRPAATICGSFGAGTGNFGNANASTIVNPAVLHGCGVRPYDWQYGVSIQQQIVPRVSVDVAFNRRSWGNFFVTDNRAVQASDYSPITITAPTNANLPGGGGYPVTFMARNANSALGITDNYYTFASDYGDVKYYWQGVDVSLNARLAEWSLLSGRHQLRATAFGTTAR